MSRMYDNKPLQNLPVINIEGPISLDTVSGNGAIIEGIIKGRTRFSIDSSSSRKDRYLILHVEVIRAHKRKFDDSGKEIEPNFSETTKVSTGYLPSSYRVDDKGQTDRLDGEELTALVSRPHLTALTKKHAPAGCISLWFPDVQTEKLELIEQDSVRIKTDGPLIFSIGKMDPQSACVSNFAGGDKVGAAWTDKIMDMKTDESKTEEKQNEDDDADWDD